MHGWQLGYPTGVWYTMRTKFLPERFQICPWRRRNIVLQSRQSRMTRTGRHQTNRPELSGKLSICSAMWMGWKNSEHRTLRTRLATDSRLNDKTTERTKRKTYSWQYRNNVIQSRHSERHERMWERQRWKRTHDMGSRGYPFERDNMASVHGSLKTE